MLRVGSSSPCWPNDVIDIRRSSVGVFSSTSIETPAPVNELPALLLPRLDELFLLLLPSPMPANPRPESDEKFDWLFPPYWLFPPSWLIGESCAGYWLCWLDGRLLYMSFVPWYVLTYDCGTMPGSSTT